jgi:hypothetical protein
MALKLDERRGGAAFQQPTIMRILNILMALSERVLAVLRAMRLFKQQLSRSHFIVVLFSAPFLLLLLLFGTNKASKQQRRKGRANCSTQPFQLSCQTTAARLSIEICWFFYFENFRDLMFVCLLLLLLTTVDFCYNLKVCSCYFSHANTYFYLVLALAPIFSTSTSH